MNHSIVSVRRYTLLRRFKELYDCFQKESPVHTPKLDTILSSFMLSLVLLGCGTGAGETGNRSSSKIGDAIVEVQKLGGRATFDEDVPSKPIYAVDFSDTQIGDDALKNVEGMTELKTLILAHTQVTDAGLRNIVRLNQLQTLLLDGTQITDAGLDHIMGLAHLERLSLDNTQVTDSGLKQIGEIAGLKSLSLDDTRITDKGLKHLNGLKQLQKLYTLGTQVSQNGLKELKQALPNLQLPQSIDDTDRP